LRGTFGSVAVAQLVARQMEEHVREVWTMEDHVENLAAIDAGTVEERRHDPDLADVFFHLTGHELRDGDAPEGPAP